MKFDKLIMFFIIIIFLSSCSSSYKELTKIKNKSATNFQDFLMKEYKNKAIFEAEEMHDWNSAKLYSEKALKSQKTDEIYPEDLNYWKIHSEKISEIKIAHENLMDIYNEAKNVDPYNLAKAISSLDCWAEQLEEGWQTWDINNCRDDFLRSIHSIYEQITEDKNNTKPIEELNKKDEATVVTKGINDQLIQIIYFDFDKFELSNVSINKIYNFLNENKNQINEYLIVGHTDTKGTKKYNLNLSIKRAEIVKDLLIEFGIEKSQIKILGKGEELLAIETPDNTKQPANRRVEIKKRN